MWNDHCPGSMECGLILISLAEISRLVSHLLFPAIPLRGRRKTWRVSATIFPSRHCESPSELRRLSQHRDWKDRGTFWLFPWACLSDCPSVRSRSIRLVPTSTRTSLRIASKLPSLSQYRAREERAAFHSCEIMSPVLDGRTDRPYSHWMGV